MEIVTMEEISNPATSENETIEFIRDEIRDKITLSRKQQRYKKVNKNRSALGDLIENDGYTEVFVTATTKSLKKKALNIHEYRKLQNALIQSDHHINAFLKVDNAIQGLSRDLSSSSAQSKLAAASCCCNLALGNSKACIALCKFTGPYLIAELESSSQPLAEVCAWTIGNLSSESKKAFSILHAQGCMKSLIKFSQQSSDILLPAASYALLRYIRTGANVIDIIDITKLCEIIVARYPEVSDIDTMWILAVLSSKIECIKYLIKCIPLIVNYLHGTVLTENEDIAKISAVLRILCNVISEPSGQVADYFFKRDIQENQIFFNKLLSYPYIHIRKETLWLLGNLYNHAIESVQQITKSIVISLPALKLVINSFNE